MSHAPHPPIGEAGLAAAAVCARCAEMGERPFETLDDDNLALLVARSRAWMRDEEFSRSDSELAAMRIMETTLRRMDQLDRVARYAADRQDKLVADALEAQRQEDGPTDDEIYDRVGVEGGIAYDTSADEPGSLGENDWRL